jgi:hypothetical protein
LELRCAASLELGIEGRGEKGSARRIAPARLRLRRCTGIHLITLRAPQFSSAQDLEKHPHSFFDAQRSLKKFQLNEMQHVGVNRAAVSLERVMNLQRR